MIKNRIVKWAAAGILALGAIPAIGMGRSHVSLPTSAVTITPTGAPTMVSHTVTRRTSARVHKASVRSHARTSTAAKHGAKQSLKAKHSTVRHTASAKRKTVASHSRTKASHVKASSHHVKNVSARTHHVASHKAITRA